MGSAELVPLRERTGHNAGRGRPRVMDALTKQTYINLVRQGYRRVKSAELVGVSYDSVSREIKRDEEFARALRDAEDARIDEVEEALYETAISGNFQAQHFVLLNRRADQWRDARTIREREVLAVEAEERKRDEELEPDKPSEVETLRESLLGLRARMTADPEAADDDDDPSEE